MPLLDARRAKQRRQELLQSRRCYVALINCAPNHRTIRACEEERAAARKAKHEPAACSAALMLAISKEEHHGGRTLANEKHLSDLFSRKKTN